MEEPGFWDDPDRSTRLVREAKNLKDEVGTFRELEQEYEDIQVMIQMGYEENDPSVIPDIQEMLDHFTETLEKMRMKLLLSGEYDSYDAILRLNAGAGGTESCDWCSMLYRMYCRWAEKKGFKLEVLDYLDGDEAGIKSVTIQISGDNAYGYLRSEHGVHRLVRISPFNAAGKRQTSFVSCDVMPDIKEDIDIDRHSKYIIKRVLEYGVWNDWMVLRIYYGLPRIVEEVKKMRDLEPRALAYIASISNTPKEEFRCYTYQHSIPQHWNF